MSFILDALRKSEHERQRTTLPGIARVPFGIPRRELPAWTIGVIAVLGIAVLALGGAWWRSTLNDPAAGPEPAARSHTEIPLALPPAASAAPPAGVYSAPPSLAAERATAPNGRTAEPASAAANEGPSPERDPVAAEKTAASDALTLPSPAALAAQGVALPQLRLELHAYSSKPAERFVFINGTKYLEGATLAEGPRLVTIAPNGAILVYLGHRFLLAQQ